MFKRHTHEKDDARGSGLCLLLSKVRTEVGSIAVAFQGALNVNELPADLQNEPYIIKFKRKLDTIGFV